MLTSLLLAVTALTHVTGFQAPESAYWDAASRTWYVSNVAGNETDKDGKGWISTLDADGRANRPGWLSGLNAPKGIRARGTTLYVSDIDELVAIDIPNRKILSKIKAPGAKFLNDVAIGPQGEVYVSDTLKNAIYRCTTTCDVWVEGVNLEGPNGLLVEGGRLIVAAFGLVTDPVTFGTKTPGRLLAVDLKTKKVTILGTGKPIGNLDGLEKDAEDYLVTDNIAGKLLRVSQSGAVTVLKDGFKNCADIGYDATRGIVAVPEMGGGTVQFLKLEK
jgi:sugar lactone lactonase YvrE